MAGTGGLPGRVGAIAVLCMALAASGCTGGSHHHHDGAGRAVTYRVSGHGTADITYRAGRGGSHGAGSAHAARLPWSTTVHLPARGGTPVLTVVLGSGGGRAACSITVAGRQVQRAVATGGFGRATCRAEDPAAGAAQGPGRG
jgi:hypothetical protein